VAFLWNLSVVGADALIVPFLRHAVGLNGAQAGWVLGAGGLAGLLSAPVVSGVTTRYGGLRLLSGCILMSGVAILLLAFAPGLWLALAGNVLLALSGFTATTAFIGERQKLAPPHLQARVGITGRMLALGTVTAAGLIASALASAVALRPLFVAFGLAAFCVAAWAAPALSRAEAARTEPACGAAG
jgi:predicted MFS family arabinose efflux permease